MWSSSSSSVTFPVAVGGAGFSAATATVNVVVPVFAAVAAVIVATGGGSGSGVIEKVLTIRMQAGIIHSCRMKPDITAAISPFPPLTADTSAIARALKACRRDMSKKEEQLLSPEDHERLAAAALKSEAFRGRFVVAFKNHYCLPSYPLGTCYIFILACSSQLFLPPANCTRVAIDVCFPVCPCKNIRHGGIYRNGFVSTEGPDCYRPCRGKPRN